MANETIYQDLIAEACPQENINLEEIKKKLETISSEVSEKITHEYNQKIESVLIKYCKEQLDADTKQSELYLKHQESQGCQKDVLKELEQQLYKIEEEVHSLEVKSDNLESEVYSIRTNILSHQISTALGEPNRTDTSERERRKNLEREITEANQALRKLRDEKSRIEDLIFSTKKEVKLDRDQRSNITRMSHWINVKQPKYWQIDEVTRSLNPSISVKCNTELEVIKNSKIKIEEEFSRINILKSWKKRLTRNLEHFNYYKLAMLALLDRDKSYTESVLSPLQHKIESLNEKINQMPDKEKTASTDRQQILDKEKGTNRFKVAYNALKYTNILLSVAIVISGIILSQALLLPVIIICAAAVGLLAGCVPLMIKAHSEYHRRQNAESTDLISCDSLIQNLADEHKALVAEKDKLSEEVAMYTDKLHKQKNQMDQVQAETFIEQPIIVEKVEPISSIQDVSFFKVNSKIPDSSFEKKDKPGAAPNVINL